VRNEITIEFGDSRESPYIHSPSSLLCFKATIIGQNLIAENLIAQIKYRALEFSL